MQYSAMDQASICSSDLSHFSDGISNDTFDMVARGRQDMIMDDKLESSLLSMQSPRCASAFVCHNSSAVIGSAPLPCLVNDDGAPALKKRKVSFDGPPCVINESTLADESITQEDQVSRWWSQEDLDLIKQSAKEMSIRLRRQAKERGCFIETAHKKTSLMLTNNFRELVKLSPATPDQDLRHWCARSDGRRGLERFASREYGNMRKDDVADTRNSVLEEQKRQRCGFAKVSPEAIAKVSKLKSRRSRTFSLFMGEADAQAATARQVPSRNSSKRCKVSHPSSVTAAETPLLRSAA
ncbi:expressed unknown protein [Seminavis robusta]|uniref:Uncharacterized protein n=1 Tax=Seminavis robusta TaxID=568900 RepID=A0A9N8EK91_9STRA|nr:expressed unknown protein [Seminavis robusta]|eukprot:Sro1346_g264870.1 n/a (296) ;mRNA; r:23073-23960